MDEEMLQQQIDGLTAQIKTKRDELLCVVKAQGLIEEAEKARVEAEELAITIQATKEAIAELKGKKRAALKATCDALSTAITEALPYGEGRIGMSEDGQTVWIGWGETPYEGLSGGEKAMFEAALSRALLGTGEKCLIMECAELDDKNLWATMDRLSKLGAETQVIMLSCHAPMDVPAGWRVERIGDGTGPTTEISC